MPEPKIYFAGAIRGGRTDRDVYRDLIGYLQSYGDVLTEHIGDQQLGVSGEKGLTDEEICQRDVGWLERADVFIAEVTTPSLGVGYEVALAAALEKPVLCLYRQQPGRRLSAMIAGNRNLIVRIYHDLAEIPRLVDEFFGSLGMGREVDQEGMRDG